jgi:hypothetical protein
MVKDEYPNKNSYQSWVTDLQLMATEAPAGQKIIRKSLEIAEMLIKKNVSYGNSALNPARVFSKADNLEGLRIRLDDKITRIQNSQGFPGDNDIDDMIGYLVLYKIGLDSKRSEGV